MGDVEQKDEAKKTVRSESDDGVLKVADVKVEGPSEMRVFIEGTDLERLSGSEAKALAFEQRLAHGRASAGVEAVASTFVPQDEYDDAAAEERDVARWQREFRLVNML